MVSEIIDKIMHAQVYEYIYEIVMLTPYLAFKNLAKSDKDVFKDDGFFEKHIYDNIIYG